MPNFSNLESLSSVRTKINNAITLTEQNALDLDAKQPLDGDLSAIASLVLTDVIYYRSAPSTWTPVTIGANLSFVSGVLSTTGSSSIAWTDVTGKPSFGTASLANTGDFASNLHTHIVSDVIGLAASLSTKQDTLVSSTNIKTINGGSVVGSGNLTISASPADGNFKDIVVSSGGTVFSLSDTVKFGTTLALQQNVFFN